MTINSHLLTNQIQAINHVVVESSKAFIYRELHVLHTMPPLFFKTAMNIHVIYEYLNTI